MRGRMLHLRNLDGMGTLSPALDKWGTICTNSRRALVPELGPGARSRPIGRRPWCIAQPMCGREQDASDVVTLLHLFCCDRRGLALLGVALLLPERMLGGYGFGGGGNGCFFRCFLREQKLAVGGGPLDELQRLTVCSADPTTPHQSGTSAAIPVHRRVGRELVRDAAPGRPVCAATGCGRCPSAWWAGGGDYLRINSLRRVEGKCRLRWSGALYSTT
eukprot:COSAG02_NODE_218_length_28570_cov_75.594816_16_plen_218_part_00